MFSKKMLWMGLLGFMLAIESVTSAAAPRPNFVFILTDDQRYDALGVVQREQKEQARFPWLQTPNMDRIATEGVRFRNAFVTLALCAPSRSAFLTGRYNHNNRVVNNHTDFPATNKTYAAVMLEAGYSTAYFGKFHHGSQRGNRPGFAHSTSFLGQGVYEDCVFEVNGKMTPTKGWVDDVSTDFAIGFIKQNRSKPFSIVIGYKSSHVPVRPPERASKRFDGVTARPVPNMTNIAIFRPEPEGQELLEAARAALKANKNVPVNVDYFRCLSAVDDNVGRIMKALDEEKLAENTVLVFAGDNGYYMGEHGLGDKRSAYDESLRIPLLVRYPQLLKKAQIREEMVLNIDLAPTFLELAGLSAPSTMQGRSWVPLLKGKGGPWRKSFLAEYFIEGRFPNTPTLLAVRTETAKLVQYPGVEKWTELFDLSSDPYEQRNLAAADEHKELLEKMKAELERLKAEAGYCVPDTADKAEFVPGKIQKKKAGKRRKGL